MNRVLWSAILLFLLCQGLTGAEELQFYGDPDEVSDVSGIESSQSSVEFVPDNYSPYQATEVPLTQVPRRQYTDSLFPQGQTGRGPQGLYGTNPALQYPGYRNPGYYPPPSWGGYTQPFGSSPMGSYLTPGSGFPLSW